jgi:hypothetical protein
MQKIKWLIKGYMAINRIRSFQELAELTGIKYTTLLTHLNNPSELRAYEIRELDAVLHFEDKDLIVLIREGAA